LEVVLSGECLIENEVACCRSCFEFVMKAPWRRRRGA
jgi:hypothetical protein